jgi:hypothetical protein
MVVNMKFYANYQQEIVYHINIQYFGNFKHDQHIKIQNFFFLDVCHFILIKIDALLTNKNHAKLKIKIILTNMNK